MKKAALFPLLALAGVSLISCYKGTSYVPKPPSGLYERVLASQDVSSLTSNGGLVIVDGQTDVLPRVSPISAGISPGLMALSPTRATLLAFDSSSNRVAIVNTKAESVIGLVQLPGPTTSMVIPSTDTLGYAAVPTAPLNGAPIGAVEMMDLTVGAISATIGVPNVQTVVANPSGALLLAFSNDSDTVTIVQPLNLNTSLPVTSIVAGFDRPVYGLFSSDGTVAYILNCGAECGGTQASVQILDLGTTPPTAGASVPVDGATMGLINGSTLLVAGASPTNNACTGETTAATSCGRLDMVDLGSFTVTGSAVITDGYHTVMSLSVNGQLFIGARTCTNVGNVNNVQGEVRGCLSIYNTTNNQVVIPPDNGDVTDLQNFTSRDVEYVAEGGNLRVYDTTIDSLLFNSYVSGTIAIVGQVIDVKAIDFF